MKKHIYRNKETGQKVVTSETLAPEHWEQVNVIKGAKMEGAEVHTKSKRVKKYDK